MVVAVALGALAYHGYLVCENYFAFKVNVAVDILHRNELTFPSVTICNMSPVKKSSLGNHSFTSLSQSLTAKRRRKRAAPGDYLFSFVILLF